MNKKLIISQLATAIGPVAQVSSRLTWRDTLGTFLARWTWARDDYKVDPGLYALGKPDADAFVFVCANYKMSFDVLRSQLKGLNVWLLVLDTKGINVWCAAGKKTFGTEELVRRIRISQLDKIVKHRKIIVPQLGAAGVAAYKVKKESGFTVIYGPVRANDILDFLDNSLQATALMRTVKFSFYDRMVLVPAELVMAWRYLGFIFIVFFLFSGLSQTGFSRDLMVSSGKFAVLNIGLGYIAGTVIGPLFLPWLPGKSFSLKGVFAGVIAVLLGLYFGSIHPVVLEALAWSLIIISLSSFLTMNFTGSSTYTSLSGVKKEMRVAVPLQFLGILVGCGIGLFIKLIG